MRENRLYGSEGGEVKSLPYPYQGNIGRPTSAWIATRRQSPSERRASLDALARLAMTVDPFPVKLPNEVPGSPTQPSGAPSEPAPSRAPKIFFLNYLTENRNYDIVTDRWTKGASHADGKRPFPSRMAKTKG